MSLDQLGEQGLKRANCWLQSEWFFLDLREAAASKLQAREGRAVLY